LTHAPSCKQSSLGSLGKLLLPFEKKRKMTPLGLTVAVILEGYSVRNSLTLPLCNLANLSQQLNMADAIKSIVDAAREDVKELADIASASADRTADQV
jgi:hypothetical protein